jgi:recombination protein RecT
MKGNELALVKKDTVDVVAAKIKQFKDSGELHFPNNYSPDNAMKSAWLTLQNTQDRNKKHALDVCTKDSIANSLLDMVIQGLSPSKKQCYFIVYGNQLQLMRSYFGTMAVTKRLSEVKDIRSQVIYQDDEFELLIDNGVKTVTKHNQKLSNIDMTKIVGAYTIIGLTDGGIYTEIMNINQIKQAWGQSSMNVVDKDGNIAANSVHGKFTDQMVLKTVINRACKNFANTSNDSDLLIESFNRSTENEYEPDAPTVDDKVVAEIEDNANNESLDFENEQPQEVTEESKVVEPEVTKKSDKPVNRNRGF